MQKSESVLRRPVNRRSLLKGGMLAGGAAVVGTGLFSGGKLAFGQDSGGDGLTKGDVAILRFLAAAELIETDLWIQYAELGGIGNNPPIEVDPGETLNPYQTALSNLDSDGPQYIASNTLDEMSHANFLNAYLQYRGAEPVDFERFRTLREARLSVASGKKRLTNLMNLNGRYQLVYSLPKCDQSGLRRHLSPGDHPQELTAIPRSDADLNSPNANHFRRSPTRRPFTLATSSKVDRAFTSHESKGVRSGSVTSHPWHWRRRDRSLPGMGRFCGQWSATHCCAVHGQRVRPNVPQLFRPTQSADSAKPDLPGPLRIHKPQPAALRSNSAIGR